MAEYKIVSNKPEVQKASRDRPSDHFTFMDGLRGYFAFSVVANHASQDVGKVGEFGGPFWGVPGFFVMSSFLITYGLHGTLQKKGIRSNFGSILAQYAIKRVFRVYPLFFITAFIVQHFRGYGEDCDNNAWQMITLQGVGCCYLWTIRPEMLNYLYMPVYVYSLHWHRISIVGWIVWFIWCEKNWSPRDPVNDWSAFEAKIPQYWHSAFLFGSFMATLFFWVKPFWLKICDVVQENSDKSRIVRWLSHAVKVGIDFLWIYWAIKFVQYAHPRYSGITDVNHFENHASFAIGALIFLGLFLRENSFSLYVFESDLWRLLGRISYSWYLLHRPIHMYIWHHRWNQHWREEFVLFSTIFSGFVAYFTFSYIEKPIMDFGYKLCKKIDRMSTSSSSGQILPKN